jgi:hypothetical protein
MYSLKDVFQNIGYRQAKKNDILECSQMSRQGTE